MLSDPATISNPMIAGSERVGTDPAQVQPAGRVGRYALLILLAAMGLGGTSTTAAQHAIRFTQNGDFVSFGAVQELGLPTFTIETWFRREAAGFITKTGAGGVEAVPILTKGRREEDGDDRDMNYFLGIHTTSSVLVADFEEGADGASPGLNHPLLGTTAVTSGVWHHAAVTYDGVTLRIYLNGVLDAELLVGQPPRSNSRQHAALGTALDSNGRPEGSFGGSLDEARIWNYARSGDEIASAMHVELTEPEEGLVARWGLNEGAGSEVTASTESGPAGTLSGSGWSWTESTSFCGGTAQSVLDYQSLRAVAGGVGQTAEVTGQSIAGCFSFSDIDPKAQGDDNGIVIASSNGGFWVRHIARHDASAIISKTLPIELDWFELVDGQDITPLWTSLASVYSPAFYVRVPNQDATFDLGPFDTSTYGVRELRIYESDAQVTIRQRDAGETWMRFGTLLDLVLGTDVQKSSRDDYLLTFQGRAHRSAYEYADATGEGMIKLDPSYQSHCECNWYLRANTRDAYANGIKKTGSAHVDTVFVSGRHVNSSIEFSDFGKSFVANKVIVVEDAYVSDPFGAGFGWKGDPDGNTVEGAWSKNRGIRLGGALKIVGSVEVQYGWTALRSFFTDRWGDADDPFVVTVRDQGFLGPESGYPGVKLLRSDGVLNNTVKWDGQLSHDGSWVTDDPDGESHMRYIHLIEKNQWGVARSILTGFGEANLCDDNPACTENDALQLSYFDVTVTDLEGGLRANSAGTVGPPADRIHHWTVRGDGANMATRLGSNPVRIAADHLTVRDGQFHYLVFAVPSNLGDPGVTTVGNLGENLTMTGVIGIESGVEEVALKNVTFTQPAKQVMSIPSTAIVTASNLNAPDGSTIVGEGTFVLDGTTMTLPYTFDSQIDTEPPSTPAEITVTGVSSEQVDLSWAPSTDNVGVAGYSIFRDGARVGSTEATTFADRGLEANTSYTYSLVAFDVQGNQSGASDPVEATTIPPRSLVSISNVVTTSGTSYVVSGDDFDQGATLYTDRHYTVTSLLPALLKGLPFIKTANDDKEASPGSGEFLTFDVVPGVTLYVLHDDRLERPTWLNDWTDTGRDVASSDGYTTYSVFERSFESGTVTLGSNATVPTSASSMYVVVVEGGPPPSAPSDLAASALSSTKIQISWDGVPGPGGEYRVYRDGVEMGATGSATYVDEGLEASTTYTYTVVAYDGAGNASVQSDPVTATTQNAGALEFAGGGDHVTFGRADALGLPAFTIETWFRREGTGVTAKTGAGGIEAIPLVTKGRRETDGNERDMNYFLGIRASDNVLAADFEEGAAGASPGLNHPLTGITPISGGVWHHAAATYDGTAWRLYLDGRLEADLAVGMPPQSASLQHAALATALDSNGNPEGFFDGALDEVRIWNYARTEAELQANMFLELDAPHDGLVARWALNEGSGSVLYGAFGSSIDGSVKGNGWAWSEGLSFSGLENGPPNPPIIVAPDDLAENISVDAELTVTASDPDGDGLSVSYYGKAASDETFVLVGIDAEVESGSTSSLTWLGLSPESTYEWRVVVDDGEGAVAGPIWTFMTGGIEVDEGDYALDFGGSEDYVTFGAAPELGLPTFTIEAWMKREGTGVVAKTGAGGVEAIPLVTKGRRETDGNDRDMNYFLGLRSSDYVLTADFEEGSDGTNPGLNHPIAGVTPVAAGAWHHVAATYDGTTWRLYLDGNLDADLQVNSPPQSQSLQHGALATALDSNGNPEGFFDGVLDEVRIWNNARSESEIRGSMYDRMSTAPANLVARWALDEGWGETVSNSVSTASGGTLQGSGWAWVASTAPTGVPDAPVLVAPQNDAESVPLSQSLEVAVSDADDDDLMVTYYGRAVDASSDFTIIGIPDTQYYTSSLKGGSPSTFLAQTQWILDNGASRNVVFVTHLGDCVQYGDNGGDDTEWQHVDAAMSLLEIPDADPWPDGIPYGLVVGNHDQTPVGNPDGGTVLYNQFFGESRFAGRQYYGGHYGSDNDNHYELFDAGGLSFIWIHLEYDETPDPAVLQWADDLLTQYRSRRAMISTHYLMRTGNPGPFSGQGQIIYDALKHNENLFLMMGGHYADLNTNVGEGQRVDVFNGSSVHSLLSNYQAQPNGGNGWMRIMEFSPANDAIRVKTYSPTLDAFQTDGDSQFELAYDMSGPHFIGEVASVPSGTSASFVWEGLMPDTQYEWYVTVSDGKQVARSDTWSFTTTEDESTSSRIGTPAVTLDESLSAAATTEVPIEFAFLGNYPDPFTSTTTLEMNIPEEAEVDVEIFDMLGRAVVPKMTEWLAPGMRRKIELDLAILPAGVYICRVTARMTGRTVIESDAVIHFR